MSVSRREFLSGAAAAGAAAMLPRSALATHAAPDAVGDAATREGFTFVHLTDTHVTTKRWGDKGYRKCVESVLELKPRPAFALMGGDLAFDGLYTPKPEFDEQIRLYREISSGLGMPVRHCMGNHDALGWSARRKVGVDDPDLGKKMMMDRLEWPKSYYSFDHAGWHFVVLDSIHPIAGADGPVYEPRIGPEQLEWLAHDVGRAAAAGKPTIAVTHIAAFCNIGQYNASTDQKAMNGSMVLWDTKDLRHVLERHGVKALLQGHSHKIEEYRFNNVWYLTSAAVSGAWWSGDWIGSPPGYTVFTCRGDRLTWEHKTFAWEPHLEPEDELERKRNEEYRELQERQRRRATEERATP